MEYLDILNPDGTPTGQSVSRERAHREGLWHRTVHVWVVTPDNRILLQRRSLTKDVYPGLWDTSAAGHIEAGGTSIPAAIREVGEELGLVVRPDELRVLGTLRQIDDNDETSIHDRELVDIYLVVRTDISSVRIDNIEVTGIRTIALDDFEQVLASERGCFVDHREEYPLLVSALRRMAAR
jgi:isopentenyldiphosphate isomerase